MLTKIADITVDVKPCEITSEMKSADTAFDVNMINRKGCVLKLLGKIYNKKQESAIKDSKTALFGIWYNTKINNDFYIGKKAALLGLINASF